MNANDKFALTGALCFFFICMALAFIWLKGQIPEADSYMPQVNKTQGKPLQNAEHSSAALPESVLQYKNIEAPKQNTVQCMLQSEYKNMVNARIVEENYTRSITGTIGDDIMEIYTKNNGAFFVIVKGANAFGDTEACIVAKGRNWAATE